MKMLRIAVPMFCLAGCTADPTSGKTRDDPAIAGRSAQLATISGRITQALAQKNKSATRLADLAAEQKDRAEAEARAEEALNRLALAGIAEKQEPRGLVITLPVGALFASGRSELLESAQGSLDEIVTAIVERPDRKIAIEGHIDSQGDDGRPLALSQRRADAIRDYFISHRVSPNRVTAQDCGPNDPMASNASAGGLASNRRIEIVIERTAVTLR